MKVDSINWLILGMLQKNSRMTHTEIAKQVGISSPAVAERIRKLEDAGVIEGYYTQVSYLKTGYQFKAIVNLRAFMGRLKPFLEKVVTFKEVVNCYRITGNENIVMEVILRDQKHLEQFIDQLITYGESKTQIVLSAVTTHNAIKKPISS